MKEHTPSNWKFCKSEISCVPIREVAVYSQLKILRSSYLCEGISLIHAHYAEQLSLIGKQLLLAAYRSIVGDRGGGFVGFVYGWTFSSLSV